MRIEGCDPRRVCIFSDIHGNLQALQQVLQEIATLDVDYLICCGDVVGYGANPNECVELLRERKIPTIAGNHDHAALSLIDITYFNEVAKRAITWTRQNLKPENEAFLRDLPLTIEFAEMLFVHASPASPESWDYIITMGHARQSFKHFGQRVCFIGHSHTPFIVENENSNLSCPDKPEITMREGCRYLVNVGSVGQPRDRNPDACFAIYDRVQKKIEIHRVKYDLVGAQDQIRQEGLPIELAERLAYGL
ncbi:MAG: metallophosphatase family protein [Candidatus Sumerlaeaceae bacterium]|nr:metallophosphatase family protein [Candidatus Sumerlaeaceae bacterium]